MINSRIGMIGGPLPNDDERARILRVRIIGLQAIVHQGEYGVLKGFGTAGLLDDLVSDPWNRLNKS